MDPIAYAPSPAHDPILADWYLQAIQAGELHRIVRPVGQALGGFLAAFRPPTRLYYTVDDAGVRLAAWGSPWGDGCALGVWIRPDQRRHRGVLLGEGQAAIRAVLEHWPIGFAIVTQERLLRTYTRCGVQFAPLAIPGLRDGPAFLGWVTAATFGYRRGRHGLACAA